jgi:hypothetical protein
LYLEVPFINILVKVLAVPVVQMAEKELRVTEVLLTFRI